MIVALTFRQRQVLDFIRAQLLETGVSPSYDEIARATGYASKGRVSRVIADLIERGALKRIAGRKRALAPVMLNAVTLELPPELDADVRRLAARANTTPEAIIVECVRDRMRGGTFRAPNPSESTTCNISAAPRSLREIIADARARVRPRAT